MSIHDGDCICGPRGSDGSDPSCPVHGDTHPTTALRKWGDEAMFVAEPHDGSEAMGVLPTVHLLWMTPDPLGAIAAMSEMYKGNVIRDLNELTDEQRRSAWEDVQQTHLQAPLEAVKLHFMLEGVDRALTHQIVRQRTAVYAQESMRFAVVEDLLAGTSLPPSLHGTVAFDPYEGDPAALPPRSKEQRWRNTWDMCISDIQKAYQNLVNDGMPAEEARGLLPHATATRMNYITDLRNLVAHSGNRLCTQAQFVWRILFSEIVQAIRNYDAAGDGEVSWQQQEIAGSDLFRPVCYQLGRCPFKASFDRACSIRDRVEAFAEHGVPSSEWDQGIGRPNYHESGVETIQPREWLMDHRAARVPYGAGQ